MEPKEETISEPSSDLPLPPRGFWNAGSDLAGIEVQIAPPEKSLELLERLGPSPFERGGFPLIGFLATTYDKVARSVLPPG